MSVEIINWKNSIRIFQFLHCAVSWFPEVKERFYEGINAILGKHDTYVIVCCSILKEPFVERFNRGEDVYGLSLKYLIERAIF